MRITHINCPGCGKAIDIDWDWSYFLCQYCHAKCVILSHNHPETPQQTLERLHEETWQAMEERNYALGYGQYREILQHRIDDGEAWHGRALAIALRAYDKENLRADEVIASFDEGLRRDPSPRSRLIYAMHAIRIARQLHQFHYLHFRRNPLMTIRWNYYREASSFALRVLRDSREILRELIALPPQKMALLQPGIVGYSECDANDVAKRLLEENIHMTATIDQALITGSLRLHGKHWIRPKWHCITKPEARVLCGEYRKMIQHSLGNAFFSPPVSEVYRYWRPTFIFLAILAALLCLCAFASRWLLGMMTFFALVGFFGFFRPIRHRLWEKSCYASDVRAGVYDYH